MTYQALYRQWRPATFQQVVGQEAVVKTLRRQIETGHIAHAYLFCGCRGTGKTTLAKIMSRAINCRDPRNGEPCGDCPACRAIASETTLDVLELDAASNNGVDNIRELLEQVRYPPQIGKYKVYIVDEVHMLSTAAFNALLKTLEEPPAHVVFILATTEPQKLPATILSRVQRYDFGRIPSALMVERMKLALDQLGVTAEDEALLLVARSAEGAMRDAFSILDMCVAGAANGVITAADTREALGASDRSFLFLFTESIAKRDMSGVMAQVDTLMRSGRDPQVFLRELTAHIRALLTVLAVPKDAAILLEVTEEDEGCYREQAKAFSPERLLKMMGLFMRAEGELRYASTPRIGLEVAVLDACQEQRGQDTAALLERVGELESQLKTLRAEFASGKAALSPKSAAAEKEKDGETEEPGKKPQSVPQRAAAEKEPQAETEEAEARKGAQPPNPLKKHTWAGDPDQLVTSLPETENPEHDPADIWQKALAALSKDEPLLFGMICKERFLGATGNAYRLLIPYVKKATYERISQPPRKSVLSQYLSEAAGVPLVFEAVLEGDLTASKREAVQAQSESMLVETFGRNLVQIDDEEHLR
ncbi:MAG: DNA polymerase III subunit gamma/tau [Clostridia bacterium]|nr:DNA polymerase III subunit gamma/tau [Clostridia bacterium]